MHPLLQNLHPYKKMVLKFKITYRKRLRIGYNSESFSVKSAYDGINPHSWIKLLRDEVLLRKVRKSRIYSHLR